MWRHSSGDRNRQRCRVRRIVQYFHIEHGGQSAEALRTDTESVDPLEYFQAQFSNLGLRPAREVPPMSMGSISDSFASSMAFSALPPMPTPEHSGRTPTGAHFGHHFQHPVSDRIRWVQHGEHGFVFRASALRGDRDSTVSPGANLPCGSLRACCLVFFRLNADRTRWTRAACCRDPGRRAARLRSPCFEDRVSRPSTPMPTLTNTTTMPVSWQIGRCPSAHMRELVRIWAIASRADGLFSFVRVGHRLDKIGGG